MAIVKRAHEHWSSRFTFLMASVGFAVGLAPGGPLLRGPLLSKLRLLVGFPLLIRHLNTPPFSPHVLNIQQKTRKPDISKIKPLVFVKTIQLYGDSLSMKTVFRPHLIVALSCAILYCFCIFARDNL
jgi:hypothetical protein